MLLAIHECLLNWQEFVSHLMNLYAIDRAAVSGASAQCKSHVKKQNTVDDVLLGMAALTTLQNCACPVVHPEHGGCMALANVPPFCLVVGVSS